MKHLLAIFLTILTTISGHVFHTECAVMVNTPASVSDTLLARFIRDFQENPDALFDWTFYGVGVQDDESKNSFLLEYKQTVYEPKRQYGSVLVDVVVPHVMRWNDILFEAKVLDKRAPIVYHPNLTDSATLEDIQDKWMRNFYIELTEPGRLIKQGFGNLYIIPVNEKQCIYFLNLNVQYGWFFDIFVTKRVYRNSVEWRAVKYMENLKREAEKIYHGQIKKWRM